MQYLRKLRAEAALQLLCNTELPAKAIARRVGLRSASHLVHLLRRELGPSPSELRRKGKSGQPARLRLGKKK
jgi:AraC-like DNA-binding protein